MSFESLLLIIPKYIFANKDNEFSGMILQKHKQFMEATVSSNDPWEH